MKKSILLGILFLLSVVTVHAYDFSDVSDQDPHSAAINYLSDKGILKGQGGELRFDPDGFLNRAEWAVILNRSAGEEPSAGGFCFPDVRDEWYAPSVCFAHEKGWIRGYEAGAETGMFVPGNTLNVAEVLVTLARQRSWQITEGSQWYTGALVYAQSANLVDSSWSFDHRLTRAEAAEVLFRTIAVEHFNVQQYDPLLADLMTPSNPSNPSSLSPIITLRSFPDMPAKATLARGSLYVPVLRFTLESNQPVTLDQLSIRRVSVGMTSDLAIARLMINGHAFQERPFSNSLSEVQWSALHQTLLPGQLFLIEMNVDFIAGAQAGLVYQFQIEPNQLVFLETGVVVDGQKVIGQPFTTAPITADTITVSNSSAKLNVPYIQTQRAIIAKFRIKSGAHDVLIKRIRLDNGGRIDESFLENFRLTVGSSEVAFLEHSDRSALDFSINDYLIEAGGEQTFTLLADILSPRIDSSIRMYMESPSDVHAYDVEFGFGTRVDNQFSSQAAWCLGSNSITCPSPGLRKHCSQDDIDSGVRDCEAQ